MIIAWQTCHSFSFLCESEPADSRVGNSTAALGRSGHSDEDAPESSVPVAYPAALRDASTGRKVNVQCVVNVDGDLPDEASGSVR